MTDTGLAPPAPPRAAGEHRGVYVLRALRLLALLGLLALLVGRALGPALPGVAVGLESTIAALRLTGDLLSQGYAVALSVGTLGLLLAHSRAGGPLWERGAWMALGGVVLFLGLRAPALRLSPEAALILGSAAALSALLAGRSALRQLPTKRYAWPFLFLAVGALLRLGAVALGVWAGALPFEVASLARSLATAALALELLGLVTALAAAAPSRGRLVRPEALVALALALFATRGALLGAEPDASSISVLTSRAAVFLGVSPASWASPAITTFATLLAPVAAATVLVIGGRSPLTGALVLALLARTTPEIPLCGMGLFVASAALSLASRDGRSLWESLGAASAGPRPEQPRSAP
jgi:hypothetical protein